jgi:hypothetical protein
MPHTSGKNTSVLLRIRLLVGNAMVGHNGVQQTWSQLQRCRLTCPIMNKDATI